METIPILIVTDGYVEDITLPPIDEATYKLKFPGGTYPYPHPPYPFKDPNPNQRGGMSFAPQDRSKVYDPAKRQNPDLLFTISTFIESLRTNGGFNGSGPVIKVDTAFRGKDPMATPTFNNFRFDSIDLSVYKALLLFGYKGTNYQFDMDYISKSEIAAIKKFMDNGGGVFATGDHGGMGSIMCGMIPRVRGMRKWFANLNPTNDVTVPANAINWSADKSTPRADTIQPDKNNEFYFDNQSSNIPMPLALMHYDEYNRPHPIFEGTTGSGWINRFPGHMHEGEVLGYGGNENSEPWALEDFPAINGHQQFQVIISQADEIAGHSTMVPDHGVRACETDNFSNDPNLSAGKTINVLSVYDGHKVGVGRIITDSSFHHYLDLNIAGDPCAATLEKQNGFQGTDILADLKTFYYNLVYWIAQPAPKNYCDIPVGKVSELQSDINDLKDFEDDEDEWPPIHKKNPAAKSAYIRGMEILIKKYQKQIIAIQKEYPECFVNARPDKRK